MPVPRIVLSVAFLLTLCSTHAAVTLISEKFAYTTGSNLTTPWTVTNVDSNNTAVVNSASTLNAYTPNGNMLTTARTNTTLGGITEVIVSGAGAGTTAGTVAVGNMYHLDMDISYGSFPTGAGFGFSLKGNGVAFSGFKFNNNAGTMTMQNLTTNSSLSFTDLAGGPSAAITADVWYHVDLDVSIASSTTSITTLSLTKLGTGGGSIYSSVVSNEISASSFIGGSSISLNGFNTSGLSNFNTANILVQSIPEPTDGVYFGIFAILFFTFFKHNTKANRFCNGGLKSGN